MIDRKALWFAAIVFLTMIAVNLWYLNLLPDWHHMPVNGPGDSHTVNSLRLFFWPLTVLLLVVTRVARRWFVSGPDEAVRPWQNFSTKNFVRILCLFSTLYAFAMAHALGFTPFWNPLTFVRFTQVAFGLLIVSMGNSVPKLPWLSARISFFRLDPWQWHRYARLLGKVRVGFGIAFIAAGLLLPPTMIAPTVLAVALTGTMAMIWYRIKLRREPQAQV